MPIQWLLTLFALFALWRAAVALRLKQIDRRKFIWWGLLWGIVIFIIWRPETTSAIAALLGVGRGSDVVIYISVAVIFFLLFHLSRKIDRLERSLTNLVRTLALKQTDEPDDK